MKVNTIRCFLKLAERPILKTNDLLVAQDIWREAESRNIVKVKKASLGWALSSPSYTGAEVSRMSQAYSPSCQSWEWYNVHVYLYL